MEDAPKLLKIPGSECPDIWIRLTRHKRPKSWSSMEDPVVLLKRNLYGHPLAGLLWERQLEKILLKHGWEQIPNWECLFVHREKGLFLSVYVDDIKLAGKKQNINPIWKVLNNVVDLGEPTSFLDTYLSGVGSELTFFFCADLFLLQLVSFTVDSAIHCNRRGEGNEHPHTRLFLDTFTHVHTSHCGSWCRTTCLHETCSSTCHHMSERLLFPCFVFFLCLS